MKERNNTDYKIWNKLTSLTNIEKVIQTYKNPKDHQIELSEKIEQYISEDFKTCEVGCEFGVVSYLLKKTKNKYLLDINEDAIHKAQSAFENLGDMNAKFFIGDMFQMPFQNEFFDIVFNAGVIEHFNKKERIEALIEYSRIMKKTGTMIIAFPNHYSAIYRIGYLILRRLGLWKFPQEYKLYDLKYELRKANLKFVERYVCSKNTLINAFPVINIMLRLFDKIFNIEGYLTVLIIKK